MCAIHDWMVVYFVGLFLFMVLFIWGMRLLLPIISANMVILLFLALAVGLYGGILLMYFMSN